MSLFFRVLVAVTDRLEVVKWQRGGGVSIQVDKDLRGDTFHPLGIARVDLAERRQIYSVPDHRE
jgi:hypothetical protein